MKKYILMNLLSLILFSLTSCKSELSITTSDKKTNNSSSFSFDGISSIDQITSNSLRINWAIKTDATSYKIYDLTSVIPVMLTTINLQSTSSYIVTGLLPNTFYQFRVRAVNSSAIEDSNTKSASATTSVQIINPPSSISLSLPVSTPDVSANPILTILGVSSGDTVKLFSDSQCITEIGSGLATSSAINITTSALAIGTHHFYATSGGSSCSSATLTYERIACPSNYISFNPNSLFGLSSGFCVMQFEAKNIGGNATSQALVSPWTGLTLTAAKTACTNLGARYDLLSNPERMAMNYAIEGVQSNWSSNALYRGHSDSSPNNPLPVTDITDPYDGTGNNDAQSMGSGKEQKRTFNTPSGEVIWDLAGNVHEWEQWTYGGAVLIGPTSCTVANTGLEWMELKDLNCGALTALDYLPMNPNYTSANGVGFTKSHGAGGAAGGGLLRGGYWTSGIWSGLYMFSLKYDSTSFVNASIGFRCVYRP